MTYRIGISHQNMARYQGPFGGGSCQETALMSSDCPQTSELSSRAWRRAIRHRIGMSSEPGSSSTRARTSVTRRSRLGSTRLGKSSASGASAFTRNAWRVWRSELAAGAPPASPPSVVVAVKALACELPHEHRLPLSRLSISEIRREVVRRGLVASIGDTTVWRWLSEDAIRPWSYRTWIFPRDPAFEKKAGRILDLYEGRWEGKALALADCIISADEKTSIQARKRIHASQAPVPGKPMRVEHGYERKGAWAYLAAWDVKRAKVHGRCERKTGIAPFQRLVGQVMRQEPYRSAPRVFWIMDNGSSHRGQRCVDRLCKRWPTIIPVHTPAAAEDDLRRGQDPGADPALRDPGSRTSSPTPGSSAAPRSRSAGAPAAAARRLAMPTSSGPSPRPPCSSCARTPPASATCNACNASTARAKR
jgi:hypothetical protein